MEDRFEKHRDKEKSRKEVTVHRGESWRDKSKEQTQDMNNQCPLTRLKKNKEASHIGLHLHEMSRLGKFTVRQKVDQWLPGAGVEMGERNGEGLLMSLGFLYGMKKMCQA